MPSLNDVIKVAEGLGKAAVSPVDTHCVAVRNRNSSCTKCVDACIADAIAVGENELSINGAACVSCGCCVAVCPTEALRPVDPTEAELKGDVIRAAEYTEDRIVIACARMAARKLVDPELYTVVPCLGRMDETFLVELACAGFPKINLVDGTCKTCKYRDSSPATDATVDTADILLAIAGVEAEIVRSSEFPPEIERDERKAESAARREFFSSAGSMVKDVAMTAAQTTLEEKLNAKKPEQSFRARMGVTKGGQLPRFEAARNMRIMDALYAALDENGSDPGAVEAIDTRLFGTFLVDIDACTGCGMCVMFCPTGALEHSKIKDEEEGRRFVEFSATDCTQCMLCQDCCIAHAAHISSVVMVDRLFDFEPQLVEIAKPAEKPRLFGRR